MAVTASQVNFIKLGTGGDWEAQCLKDGTLKFGYRETPHDACVAGDWARIQKVWEEIRGDAGTAKRDANQIRTFYEADENSIFITFNGGLLYWCRPKGPVQVLQDGRHRRNTLHGWHCTTTGGKKLTTDTLSGALLKVQMFRGTICQVKQTEYFLRKLNDELSPEVGAAEDAERAHILALIDLMRLLTWQDFELLVDLVFSSSGWRRVGVVGRTVKTVDLELILPTTEERAFVQVKSQASQKSFEEYRNRLLESPGYDRMFFVWHTGDVLPDETKSVRQVGPARLAKMVLDAGLSSWLREKVS